MEERINNLNKGLTKLTKRIEKIEEIKQKTNYISAVSIVMSTCAMILGIIRAIT